MNRVLLGICGTLLAIPALYVMMGTLLSGGVDGSLKIEPTLFNER